MRSLLAILSLTITLYADDGSGVLSGLQTWHDNAGTVAGDTYTIDAGTYVLTAPINITKGVNIVGSGNANPGGTIIQDDVDQSGNWPDKTGFYITAPSSGTTTISGIYFEDHSSGKTNDSPSGVIYVYGTYSIGNSANVRITDCTFDELDQDSGFIRWESAFGLVDNCNFIAASGQLFFIVNGNATSWTDDTNFGTDKFLYIEDCDFDRGAWSGEYEAVDSDRAARWVFRYNTGNKYRLHYHGADSGGNATNVQRGTRAVEIYANSVTLNSSSTPWVNSRSGSLLVYDNTLTSYQGSTSILNVRAYRASTYYSHFGWADGQNPWDANNTDDGAGTPGGAGDGVYESGTSTSGTGLTMTDTGKSWTPNEWIGYTLRSVDDDSGSIITANTSDTITVATNIGGSGVSFGATEQYEIRLIDKILDMPGLGKGTNDSTLVASPETADNAIEPIYVWDNDVNGGTSNGDTISIGESIIKEGIHVYSNTEHPSYTPYTYPHPLRAESAPKLLRKSRSVQVREALLTF